MPRAGPIVGERVAGKAARVDGFAGRRIALLTPYIDRINRAMRTYMEGRGFQVPVMGSFNHEDDNEVARISTASIRDAAIELGREPSVDAVFVSCTSLRMAEIDRVCREHSDLSDDAFVEANLQKWLA